MNNELERREGIGRGRVSDTIPFYGGSEGNDEISVRLAGLGARIERWTSRS